jgi:hypothetical protein
MADKKLRLETLQRWLDRLADFYQSLMQPTSSLPAPAAAV